MFFFIIISVILLQLYKEQYLLRKKLRDNLRRTCSVFPYNGDRPSLRPPFIRPPGWMPPFMIGGDYDRLPGMQVSTLYPPISEINIPLWYKGEKFIWHNYIIVLLLKSFLNFNNRFNKKGNKLGKWVKA